MDVRYDFFTNPVSSKFLKQLVSSARPLMESSLPAAMRELVALRVSQINGCGFCVDMHTKDAVAAGETQQRLHLVAVWREATVFTDSERAALELAEEGTRLADASGGVSDEVWANATKHFDEDQLGVLISTIAVMNDLNRLNVITQRPAGDYQPGQFG